MGKGEGKWVGKTKIYRDNACMKVLCEGGGDASGAVQCSMGAQLPGC